MSSFKNALKTLNKQEKVDLSQKGKKHGLCNRSACLSPIRVVYLHENGDYYCAVCASRINEANKFERPDGLCHYEKTEEISFDELLCFDYEPIWATLSLKEKLEILDDYRRIKRETEAIRSGRTPGMANSAKEEGWNYDDSSFERVKSYLSSREKA